MQLEHNWLNESEALLTQSGITCDQSSDFAPILNLYLNLIQIVDSQFIILTHMCFKE